jgi:hypothetical protein
MSEIVVDTIKLSEGVIIIINPPLSYDELISLRLINKISRKDETSFLYPALYGRFDCNEVEIISDEVYDIYESMKKDILQENIFVFEALEKKVEINMKDNSYSITSLTEYIKEIILEQNKVKSMHLSDRFNAIMQSPHYNEFIEEFGFTSSEILILRGLFKYAFLTGMTIETLIDEITGNLEKKANRKLLRKEFINVLRQRLS